MNLSDSDAFQVLNEGLYMYRHNCIEVSLKPLTEKSELPVLSFVIKILEKYIAKPETLSSEAHIGLI